MKYLSFLFLLSLSISLFGQNTESPYLQVLTEHAIIPLKETTVDAHIAGTIAHVKVTQVYQNEGSTPIEAKYVFPLSTQAAVHKMDMTIGNRTIHAEIFEKQKAREVYDQAISDGKRAAKLDQERPNVFQMNVGNIMPGDEIAIEIYYTEMLIPVAGDYQFMFPGVVGPRFTGENTSGETTFGLPYSGKGIAATFRYDLKVKLNAGMIIQHISSPSHQLDLNYPNPQTAEIDLSYSNQNPSNRDFVLNYQLRGKEIQSGLLLYEHDNENFFAYLMEPIDQPKTSEIPPREYLFIVDVSGSMNGYPLEVSKELMQNLVCNLREKDVFNILLFASSSVKFKPEPVSVTADNIESALQFLMSSRGGGGTQLLSALQDAYAMPRKFTSSARSMVVITDGYVSIEREAFEMIRNKRNEANVFTFGIGSSVNRYLIEGMAKVSQSESFVATNKAEAFKVAQKFQDYIATPLLTQVQLKAEGFDIYDVSPASIPDVFAARPVVVYGKWRGEPTGKLVVTGYQGSGTFQQEFSVSKAVLSQDNQALRYLWARKKIQQLDDYASLFNQEAKQEVTDLGIAYNLVTQYTSFVAVDQEIANKTGEAPKTVQQVLPMPANVENSAIGAEASVSEKSTYQASYKVTIEGGTTELTRAEIRQLKMWFRASFSTLAKAQVMLNHAMRIHLNAAGEIVRIEVQKNGKWADDIAMRDAFRKTLKQTAPVRQAFTISIQ